MAGWYFAFDILTTNHSRIFNSVIRRSKAGSMSCSFKPEEVKVALLAGGKSAERDISILSGQGSKEALEQAGFSVTLFDPARKEDLVALIQGDFDVAFLALHGKYGEDGTVQGFLETIGLPYTGPGVWSSATAIDKMKAKDVYLAAGIPTPGSMTIESPSVPASAIVEAVGSHCVVKAATQGSALGVYVCNGDEEVAEAVKKVFEVDTCAFAESFVEGPEFTVAVLGNEEPFALPVIKIVPSNEFYDFESKYAQGGSQHICPAPLSEEETAAAQTLAVKAHKALGCQGVSRTDLIQDEEGNFWVLETNTIPGMTSTSLLPDAASAAGISFPELCVKLVGYALQR